MEKSIKSKNVKRLALYGMLSLVFLFAGMFMALMLFAGHASWVMEGAAVPPEKARLLKTLAALFLTVSVALAFHILRAFK